ncbi:MAG TPA: hypothetical protein PLO67_22190, partial [Saprospiraceae bacterium]|nr:hypothetical protein [Saprospiraceae bacterium]
MKKRLYFWLFLLLTLSVIVWKLYSNKKALETEAELSKVPRAFIPVQVTQPQLETLANTLQADGIFLPVKEMFVISETAGRVLETYKNKGEWVT